MFSNVCAGKITGSTGHSNKVVGGAGCSMLIVAYSVIMSGKAGYTGYSTLISCLMPNI
jgi:hypothetical protein